MIWRGKSSVGGGWCDEVELRTYSSEYRLYLQNWAIININININYFTCIQIRKKRRKTWKKKSRVNNKRGNSREINQY